MTETPTEPPREASEGTAGGEIAELMPDPLVLRRWEDGTVLYANRPFAELLGRPAEEIVGRRLDDLGIGFRQEQRGEYLERLEEEGTARNFLLRIDLPGEDRRRAHLLSSKLVEHRGERCVLSVAKDVTGREETKRRLERTERRYRALFDKNVAGTFRTRLDGEILECNEAFAEMLGYDSPAELVGEDTTELYADPAEREERIEQLREEPLADEELELERRDGSSIWVRENSFLVEDPRSGETVNMGTLVETTEERELKERLREQATHDDLTGLLNRRALFDRAEQVLALCARKSRKAAVVYVDISGFQQVNEQLGHKGGDEVLASVGRRLEETMRESDLVARVGGDEFVVLAPQIEDSDAARQVGRRVLFAFDEPFVPESTPLQLRAAVGVALYPDDGSDFDTLLHRADDALWGPDRSKAPGVRRYRASELEDEAPTWEVARHLKRALQRGSELDQVYQPIVTAGGEELIGLETLVRWRHPERGTIAPAQFLPEAEAAGVIRQIDKDVVRGALDQVGEWSEGGLSVDWVSVNLSAQSLSDPDFAEWIGEALADRPDVDPGQVVVEITEHTAIQQVARSKVLEVLENDIGVSISIDDFGIGYSSLLYLRRFPAEFLKIDKQFVDGVAGDEADQKVVKGIVALGRAFDLELIAEGVESEADEAWLREAGCDYLQGFRFGRPAPAGEVEELLA